MSSPSPFDRSYIREQKRSEIVRVAGQMFCSIGYQRITVEDIASQLGLTKTIIYYYFSSKQDIFKVCHTLATELLERAFQESFDDDPLEHLRKFIHSYVALLIGNESPGAVLLDIELLPEDDRVDIQLRREAVHTQLRKLVESLVAQGRIEKAEPKLVVLMLTSSINIIPKWYRVSGSLNAETVALHYANVFVYGLRPIHARPPK